MAPNVLCQCSAGKEVCLQHLLQVLTFCCCAGSGEEGVMEDVKGDKICVHKVDGHMHKRRVLTPCCCAGSGEGVMEDDVKRDKCVHKVDGHMHKNKSTYPLLLCR